MENKRLEPYIELDGGYAKCPVCYEEVYAHKDCPKCHQLIDWSWLHDKTEKSE